MSAHSLISSFVSLFSETPKKRKLFLIDGDSVLHDTWVYEPVLGSSEVIFVRVKDGKANEPSTIRPYPEIVREFLDAKQYRNGKEVSDKYIGMLLQKAISDGYTDINIVSRDHDMIDLARMALQINEFKQHTNINVIMPNLKLVAADVSFSDINQHNATVRIYRVKQRKSRK